MPKACCNASCATIVEFVYQCCCTSASPNGQGELTKKVNPGGARRARGLLVRAGIYNLILFAFENSEVSGLEGWSVKTSLQSSTGPTTEPPPS